MAYMDSGFKKFLSIPDILARKTVNAKKQVYPNT